MSLRPGLGPAAAWLSAALSYLILEAVAAAVFPHYSYARNFISDLGAAASPRAWVMNTAFCVQGTLFFVAAVLAVRAFETRRARLFLGLAAANMVGNLLIAVFHSGPSPTAWVHVTGAVLAIVGGNAANPGRIVDDRWMASRGVGGPGRVRSAQLRVFRDRFEAERDAARGVGAMQRLFDYRVGVIHRPVGAQPAAHCFALSSSSSLKTASSPGISQANACRVRATHCSSETTAMRLKAE